jgi:hypothetical protein
MERHVCEARNEAASEAKFTEGRGKAAAAAAATGGGTGVAIGGSRPPERRTRWVSSAATTAGEAANERWEPRSVGLGSTIKRGTPTANEAATGAAHEERARSRRRRRARVKRLTDKSVGSEVDGGGEAAARSKRLSSRRRR